MGRLPQPHATRRWITFKKSSLNSDVETTPKTTDWSQPLEVDDSWAPEWLQPEEENLRGPTILDPQVAEFLSGGKAWT